MSLSTYTSSLLIYNLLWHKLWLRGSAVISLRRIWCIFLCTIWDLYLNQLNSFKGGGGGGGEGLESKTLMDWGERGRNAGAVSEVRLMDIQPRIRRSFHRVGSRGDNLCLWMVTRLIAVEKIFQFSNQDRILRLRMQEFLSCHCSLLQLTREG